MIHLYNPGQCCGDWEDMTTYDQGFIDGYRQAIFDLTSGGDDEDGQDIQDV